MSIYATSWILQFPAEGESKHFGWIQIYGQSVPGHIGNQTPGYGYEEGDPYAEFLPPPLTTPEPDDDGGQWPPAGWIRAMVIVSEKTEKGTETHGQQYVDPLLVLSGEEYRRIPFPELVGRIYEALQERADRALAMEDNP